MSNPQTSMRSWPTTRLMLCIAVLATIVCVGLFAAVRSPGVSNDLTQVLTVARNITRGDGVVTDTLYYEQHHLSGKVPVPQTVFPPGQPIVVAMLMRLGLEEMTAARVVSGVGFLLIPTFLLLLCARSGLPKDLSFVVAVLWLCIVLAWYNMVGRASDVLFIGLTMVSACWLARERGSSFVNSGIAGLVAALALTVRYAGLFFMLAVGIWLVWEWFRERTSKRLLTLIAFCVPAAAMAGFFFYRNYTIVGDIKGGNNYAEPKSVIDVVRGMYLEHTRLTGFDFDRLRVGGVAEICLVLMLGLAGILCFRHGIKRSLSDAVSVLRSHRMATFSLIYSVVTYAMLLVLEVNSQPGARNRMYMAATPFVLCLVSLLLYNGGREIRRGFRILLFGALVTFILGQVNVAWEYFGKTRQEHHWYNLQRVMKKPMRDSTVGEWLQERISRESPLLTNEPQRMGEMLRRPVIGLPSPLYTTVRWDSESVREVAERFHVEYLLVLTDKNSLQFADIDFFKDVVEQRKLSWATIEFETGNVLLFRVLPDSK